MKNSIAILIISFLFPLLILAQTKPQKKEKPPTQKEIEDMMKEMQKELDGMSPEDKKMMDSMGVKMTSLRNVPKVSAGQMASAWEDESRIVPKKDDKRIAAIPKKVNDASIKTYLAAIQKKTADLLTTEVKATGEKIYDYIQANSKNSGEASNMATALWLAGKQEFALLVIGKISAADPSNTDNLSNYASMLSMLGAQHLAIPILNNLNTKFPKNSTLLNNLGQAWFGLGDISKAEKYLDSAIRIYAYHPQANLTKAAIEESKGNISKAIEAVKKSIKHSYTKEKEDKLRELGHKLNIRDLRFPFKPGPDPLGLEKFRRPDYPTSVSELKMLKPLWQSFDQECDAVRAQLQNEKKEISALYEQSLKSGGLMYSLPLHIRKASLQLDEIKAHYEIEITRVAKQYVVLATDLDQIKQQRKRVAPEAPCEAHLQAENDFLKNYNERKKAYDEEMLKVFKHFINDMAYWSQYTAVSKVQFQLVVLEFQIEWISKLKEYRPLLSSPLEYSECAIKKEDKKQGKLAEFDNVACNYNDTMNLKIIKFTNNCSRMTSEFDFMFLNYIRKDNFERPEGDTYMSSTVKVSAEAGKDLKAGPLKVEAKIGAGVELEFGREGVEDVILIGEAKAGAGTGLLDEDENEGIPGIGIGGKDAFPTTVEAGVEGRISLISGRGQVNGTGMMQNIRLAEW